MDEKFSPGITLLGLGPGDASLLTLQAWELLHEVDEIYVRTRYHPAVAGFPKGVRVESFDYLYEACDTFEQVYEKIVERVLELAHQPKGVVYGVPGHPFVAETTTTGILRRAKDKGIAVKVVAGISFLEAVFSALEIDPLPYLFIVDALELSNLHHPNFPPSFPTLVAQIYSPVIASEVKLTLMALYPDEHEVRLVHAAGTSEQRVEVLPLYEIDRSSSLGMLTSMYLPPLAENASFEALQEIVAHLRAPDGCPWDREQNHQSLRPYLLEETYEVLEALDNNDSRALQEELGDLLLQVVLHAQIANEMGEFNMSDVLVGVHEKLIRRHPHVFAGWDVKDSKEVLRNWQQLKEIEKEEEGKSGEGLLDGVAATLPALLQAEQYQKRVARVGFDWRDIQGVFDKVVEEIEELRSASNLAQREKEIGDLLFSVVNLARWMGVEAESALRTANARFRKRFSFIEAHARAQGRNLRDFSLDEMDALWNQAKMDLDG